MEDRRESVVEIKIRADGKVVWLNSATECIARVCGIEKIILDDERAKPYGDEVYESF